MLSSHVTISPFLWLHNKFLLSHQKTIKGRTIRKVMGKNQTKIHARENAKKKNSCKEEGKEKKFMQKEDPVVTVFRKSEFQKSTILPGTI